MARTKAKWKTQADVSTQDVLTRAALSRRLIESGYKVVQADLGGRAWLFTSAPDYLVRNLLANLEDERIVAAMAREEEFVSMNLFKTFENVGDSITGTLVTFYENATWQPGSEEIKGQFALLTDEGLTRINHTAQLETLRALPPGTRVKITYTGEVVTASKRKVKKYDIGVSKASYQQLEAQLLGGQAALPAVRYEPEQTADDDPYAETRPPHPAG